MPRPSIIDHEDVANAVLELRENGKPINPYQIKKLLGQGSEAKIAYYLQAIDINYDLDEEDPLTKRLTNLVRPIALELNEQKLQQVSELKGDYERELKAKNDETTSLSDQLKQREMELEKLTADLLESNSKYDALQTNFRLTEESYNDLRLDLSEEQARHNETKIKLESSRDTITALKRAADKSDSLHKQRMEELRSDHNKQLAESTHNLNQVRSDLTNARAEINHAQKEMAKLSADAITKDNEISSLSDRAAQLLAETKDMAKALETNRIELQASNNSLTEQELRLNQQTTKIESQAAEISSLQEQLAGAVETIDSLEKKNDDVSVEKSNLQAQYAVLENVINKLNLVGTNKESGSK